MPAAARVLSVICLLGMWISQAGSVSIAFAQESTRYTTVIVPYTEYEWWVINWWDNSVLCQALIDHEGMPSLDEVAVDCGWDLANAWFNTHSCKSQNIGECVGVYVFLASITPKEREVQVELPPAQAMIHLEGCSPSPPTNFCATLPTLVILGSEPLPEHRVELGP